MGFKNENSDINTVVRTGNLIKEVREAETRRMMTTGTRLLMMTLLTTGVGTSEVEDNAFRMVREKVQRGPNGSKKAEFNQYSRLNKRDKIRFLVRNREEKIVKDLNSVKVNVIKELEKELFKEVKATWKRLEEVHR